jgi:hypothetical protein
MGDIYALLVGINKYLDPRIPELSGCVNDVRQAAACLEQRRRPGAGWHPRELIDHDATGAAIVDGIRDHLGQAGPGDVALFWFSGHGSTEPVGDFWYLERDGKELQTLVCADSRVDGNPELLDKELAVLLDELAQRGCHVVAVLDSCHSGGGTRGRVAYRSVEPAVEGPSHRLLPDLAEWYAGGPPEARHVLLAACRPEEKAGEKLAGGTVQGRFSRALLQALTRAQAGTTYRELALLARNQVEQESATQRPMVFPDGPGLADSPLFGGVIGSPPTFVMRYGVDGWEVNAGAAHGIVARRTRLAVEDSDPVREVEPTIVMAGRSLVEPIGWQPDPARVYRLVLTRPPHPTLFGFADGYPGELPAVADDPYVRIVDVLDAELIVEPQPNGVRLIDRDRTRIATLAAFPGIADLRHIARWWRVRTLRNDDSNLAYSVLLEIVQPLPGETRLTRERPASPPGPDGTLRVAYEDVRGERRWPGRFLRLHNTTNAPLYCVLLDLTERFAVDPLLRTARIEGGERAPVQEGKVVDFFWPDGWRGTEYHDWLLLIVSTDEIDASPYVMDHLDQSREARPRDLGPLGETVPAGGDWWTSVLPIVISQPPQDAPSA